MNIQKSHLAITRDRPAINPNPSSAAIIATIRKDIDHPSRPISVLAYIIINRFAVLKYTAKVFITYSLILRMNSSVFLICLIVLIAGFFTYFFYGLNQFDKFSVPFIVGGFVLLIVGAALPSVRTTTVHRATEVPERRTKVVVKEE